MKIKHRKQVFFLLMALLAGASIANYQSSEVSLILTTFKLMPFQFGAVLVAYFLCFWSEITTSKQPFN